MSKNIDEWVYPWSILGCDYGSKQHFMAIDSGRKWRGGDNQFSCVNNNNINDNNNDKGKKHMYIVVEWGGVGGGGERVGKLVNVDSKYSAKLQCGGLDWVIVIPWEVHINK